MSGNYPSAKDVKEEQQKSIPGIQKDMKMKPESLSMQPEGCKDETYKGCDLLKDKVALITGGDSGIGRSVAYQFAKEGADVAIVYLPEEEEDAKKTKQLVEKEGRKCLLIDEDIQQESNCKRIIEKFIKEYSRIDVLVNNAAYQNQCYKIEDISAEQLEKTYRTNIFSMFYLTKHALPHMKSGSTIINSTSITAYGGMPSLIDYSSTKGAIVSFTRSLSMQLAERGIRVNGVAPGPIWTPLIPATFKEGNVEEFGKQTPMKRPGQPAEVAPSYVFLASNRSSYISGQVIHPNGGTIVNT